MKRVSTCGKCRGPVYLVAGKFEHTCGPQPLAPVVAAASESMGPASADSVRFVVTGPPRTKKNHGRQTPAISKKGKRYTKHLPSKAWVNWRNTARVVPHPGTQADRQYNCAALFYRDRKVGDAVGFQQGLADLLEHFEVLSDDKWITQWDGSRLLKDRDNPRVEVTLTPLEEA